MRPCLSPRAPPPHKASHLGKCSDAVNRLSSVLPSETDTFSLDACCLMTQGPACLKSLADCAVLVSIINGAVSVPTVGQVPTDDTLCLCLYDYHAFFISFLASSHFAGYLDSQ